MRTILEGLPNAFFPDLQKETDDPGVSSDLLDDNLVRPAAEDELPKHAQRGRKSPLARHLVHTVDPLDRSLPVTIGLKLSLEGARVTEVVVDTGFTHQAIERRALGVRINDADARLGLFRLVSRIEPGLVAAFALARAFERGAGVAPTTTTTQQRQLALDLCTVAESARVLAQPELGQSAGDVDAARAAAHAAAVLIDGFTAGDVFCAPFRLRRAIAREERASMLSRLHDVEGPFRRLVPRDAFAHLAGRGVLNAAAARLFGVQGPALRAAGVVDDTPTIDLETAAPAVPREDDRGDALARLCVRHDDGVAALARLRRKLLEEGSDEDAAVDDGAVKDGIATAVVRGPSGTTALLVSVNDGVIERLRVRPPDLALIAALPRALVDSPLDDVAAVIASFGIQVSAVDR